MQATNSQLTDFIGATKQYSIPIFQRAYSWKASDCIKILSDIILVAKDEKRPCHFIGSVIYLPKSQFASTINECAVIDGQQRLTTISLMLLALADYSKEYYATEQEYVDSETSLEQIKELYLINKFGKGDLKYKLKLCGDDFKVYKQLLEDRTLPNSEKRSTVFDNYKTLLSAIKKSAVAPDVILSGIRKLLLVDIPLNPEDNAQLVFETVNSTGQALTEAQKIKNYILMTVSPDEQDDLFNNSWHPMESSLSAFEFEIFFRYYMTVKLKKQVSTKYYDDFKDYARSLSIPTKDIVIEIKKFYDYYILWKSAETSTLPIYKKIAAVKKTGQDKITPAVLQILYHAGAKVCTNDQAIKVLTIIEAYWMRRKICSLPPNTAGVVCFTMLKNLGKANYVDGFIRSVLNLTWAQRMPKDDEMKQLLHTTTIYGKSFARDLLDLLEAHENKDYTHSANHTIEHIMPQTVQSHDDLYARTDISVKKKDKIDWAIDLGENWQRIHSTYLNTIGNLTLTGFNTEYQNYRFKEKKRILDGYDSTPIRLTSKYVAKYESWGEKELVERSDAMSNIIFDIWKYPVLTLSTETSKGR